MYSIAISHSFRKELEKYLKNNPDSSEKIIKCLSELISDPDHPSIRTHKLNSTSDWSVSIDDSDRIIFSIEGNLISPLKIGSHDSVYI